MSAMNSFYGTGRRKRSVARVWLKSGEKGFEINGQGLSEYFQRKTLQMSVETPLKKAKVENQFKVVANVHGGGLAGQAGAVSLGIARALLKFDVNSRSGLREGGLLTRDPREKERKKFGRKGARKRFQYTKR